MEMRCIDRQTGQRVPEWKEAKGIYYDSQTDADHGWKGLVDRTVDGKMHIYTARYAEDQVKKSVEQPCRLWSLKEKMELGIQALGNYKPSHEEIKGTEIAAWSIGKQSK